MAGSGKKPGRQSGLRCYASRPCVDADHRARGRNRIARGLVGALSGTHSAMSEVPLRKELIATALAMNTLGINRGKSGNVSARWKDGFLITPSGLPYEETRPADIVFVNARGRPDGRREPSSEWRFHHDIYRTRQD